MEGAKLCNALIRALEERGFPEGLCPDNLNIQLDRSSVKQIESMIKYLHDNTLTTAEYKRWCELDSIGMTKEETFENELFLVEQLEREVEILKHGSDFHPYDLEASVSIKDDCSIDTLQLELLPYEEMAMHVADVLGDIQKAMSILCDDEHASLMGYEYETLPDWKVFTLIPVDGIEELWLSKVKGDMPRGDFILIRQMRHDYLFTKLSFIQDRLAAIMKIVKTFQVCETYYLEKLISDTAAIQNLVASLQSCLILNRGKEFESESDSSNTIVNRHIRPIETTSLEKELQGLPNYTLKSRLRQVKECTDSTARMIRGLHDLIR